MLSTMVVTLVVAQPRIVGVAVDDWFKLGDITVNWSSNDPNATFPPPGWEYLEEMNQTEWILFSVEGILGTNITFQATEHFKNDTDRIRSGWIDIDTGDSSEDTNETRYMTGMVISANLDVNDTVYTSVGYLTWKINETIVRAYLDEVRYTNHLNMTMESSMDNVSTCSSMNLYWDKPTGIINEYFTEVTINQTGEYLTTWSLLARITESSVWVVPEFPLFLILPLFMIATLLAVIVYRRQKN